MCYGKGEELDTEKAAAILIDDFRSGKLGRMTLERVSTENTVKEQKSDKGQKSDKEQKVEGQDE